MAAVASFNFGFLASEFIFFNIICIIAPSQSSCYFSANVPQYGEERPHYQLPSSPISFASNDHDSFSDEAEGYLSDSDPETNAQSASLSDLLIENQIESKFDGAGRYFIPAGFIKENITPASIQAELGVGEHDKELVSWVYDNSKRAFATAVFCRISKKDLLETMRQFKKHGYTDKKLPLLRIDKRQSAFRVDLWKEKMMRSDFFDKQWRLLAPVFDDEQYEYELLSNGTLPFIEKDEDPKKGSFGEVFRVEIHPAHHQGSIPTTVAIKSVNMNKGHNVAGTKKAWQMEANALEMIRTLNHPHITTCLAFIRRDPYLYFMQPWADGNLREFWEGYQGPHRKLELVEQVINQLHGLADALHRMHTYGESQNAAGSMTLNSASLTPAPPGMNLTRRDTSPNDANFRHGDLKPENLLRFARKGEDLGTLKIGDLGMAKHHMLLTDARDNQRSSTNYGTLRYQAPESKSRKEDQRRSRKEDIWAMGCIVLEFIIWILHGNNALKIFNRQLFWQVHQQPAPFFDVKDDGGKWEAVLHDVVQKWIDDILPRDPECQRDSAIRDLLRIVKDKLLIVNYTTKKSRSKRGLAPEYSRSRTPTVVVTDNDAQPIRATALEFRDAVQKIRNKIGIDGGKYLLDASKNPTELPAQVLEASETAPDAYWNSSQGSRESQGSGQLSLPKITEYLTRDYSMPLVRTWEFPVDNEFAAKIVSYVSPQGLVAHGPSQRLCSHCTLYDVSRPNATFKKPIISLQEDCKLCSLLLKLHRKLGSKAPEIFKLSRNEDESCIRAEGVEFPVLSLLSCPAPKSTLQVGFPKLPVPRSEAFFNLLNSWLDDCENSHLDGCRGSSTRRLPTRLIDIGDSDSQIRLHETAPHERDSSVLLKEDPHWRYVALSHPWGDPKKHVPFCTRRQNEARFRTNIPFGDLPQTFRDAIHTTRALGIRYLWIDSICIVQGPDGDFNEEARHMETVFSSAYCVIAASRALGQRDGFLGERNDRGFVAMAPQARGSNSSSIGGDKSRKEDTFYVCEMIDDFYNDVVQGTLNKRGWVLQERALARRTIYFTKSQTYFECGHGIRCETLGRMKHYKQDFMGDPNFPEKAIEGSRALKITYFQDLYTTYSRLRFTRVEDRPIAIAGLEGRLRRAYGTDGGQHGIFGEDASGGLFHRSLLWRRAAGEGRLTPIVFSAERGGGGGGGGAAAVVPPSSWSWMACEGAIDYFDPPFRAVDWETKEIRSPWQKNQSGRRRGNLLLGTADNSSRNPAKSQQVQQDATELEAWVRNFDLEGAEADPDTDIVYDDPDNLPIRTGQKCVLIAKTKSGVPKEFWVLVLGADNAASAPSDMPVYRRIGVGKMLGEYIRLNGRGVEARIR